MFKTNFLKTGQAEALAKRHGTPLFVYSKSKLLEQAKSALSIPAPHGLSVLFAMKANPHPEILRFLRSQGIKIDASSGYEAEAAIKNGFKPEDILLTSQQLAHNLKELVGRGVQFNATSLRQLEEYGKLFPESDVSVRINPGVGSGHSKRVTVGGPGSSFGIWHEYVAQVLALAKKYKLRIKRMHSHIGAGTDPAVWQDAARTSLSLIMNFPDAETVNLGGGFKVARMDYEHGADMKSIGKALAGELAKFEKSTGRKLKLEIEPGTFMVANAGILIAKVEDLIDTGKDGYRFLKLNTGMNDILRPSMYGAQHPIEILNDSAELVDYVVVGHNCESGDILTPAPGNPEEISTRKLNEVQIGDLVLIGGVGAYCASMSAHGYNSFPSAREAVID